MLPPLEDDERFGAALRWFASGDWMEASDLFEELFFEAVGDERPLVRLMMQIATGMHHVSRGQHRAARERLEEGLRVLPAVTNARGVDLEALRHLAESTIARLSAPPRR